VIVDEEFFQLPAEMIAEIRNLANVGPAMVGILNG